MPRSKPAPKTVRLLAPDFLVGASVRLISGRVVAIPADRIVKMGEADAKPLVKWAGWRLPDGETAPQRRMSSPATRAGGRRAGVIELVRKFAANGGLI
jgi:hypothetical protein